MKEIYKFKTTLLTPIQIEMCIDLNLSSEPSRNLRLILILKECHLIIVGFVGETIRFFNERKYFE
jgi:hypothetical protein